MFSHEQNHINKSQHRKQTKQLIGCLFSCVSCSWLVRSTIVDWLKPARTSQNGYPDPGPYRALTSGPQGISEKGNLVPTSEGKGGTMPEFLKGRAL